MMLRIRLRDGETRRGCRMSHGCRMKRHVVSGRENKHFHVIGFSCLPSSMTIFRLVGFYWSQRSVPFTSQSHRTSTARRVMSPTKLNAQETITSECFTPLLPVPVRFMCKHTASLAANNNTKGRATPTRWAEGGRLTPNSGGEACKWNGEVSKCPWIAQAGIAAKLQQKRVSQVSPFRHEQRRHDDDRVV